MRTRLIDFEGEGWRLDMMLPEDRALDRLKTLARLWDTLTKTDRQGYILALMRDFKDYNLSPTDVLELVSHKGIADQDSFHNCSLDEETRERLAALDDTTPYYAAIEDRTVFRPGRAAPALFPEQTALTLKPTIRLTYQPRPRKDLP